jgi:redox-sensitive bicupin YhaK (pirin superfamily)
MGAGRGADISREESMSWQPAQDPLPGDRHACDAIATVIVPRARDLGGFEVRRALPSTERQMVGPFIFFDQMGPAEFLLGKGLDVRPHPHIGLSTLTYLFDGEIMHRDSLGTVMAIRPGELNWMTAGRGIAHSERTPPQLRETPGTKLFGIQSWVALSRKDEESAPDFFHYAASAIPLLAGEGKSVRIIAGSILGKTSPVRTSSAMFYADVSLSAGAAVPLDPDYEERGIYTVSGELDISGEAACVSAGRSHHHHGQEQSPLSDAGRRAHGWAAPYLVEFRFLAQGTHRTGKGRLAACALRQRARRPRVHSPARTRAQGRQLSLSALRKRARVTSGMLARISLWLNPGYEARCNPCAIRYAAWR